MLTTRPLHRECLCKRWRSRRRYRLNLTSPVAPLPDPGDNPKIRTLILLSVVVALAGARSTLGAEGGSCRKVSGSSFSALAKGLAPGDLKRPAYIFASGVSTLPWLIAARIPSTGAGVWITNMPPTGPAAGHTYKIQSADVAAIQASKWATYEPLRLPSHGLSSALANRVVEAEFCVINPRLVITKK